MYFYDDATTVRLIDEFMGEQNKYRHKPMSRSEAVRLLILNGYQWFNDNKILYSARNPEEYRKYQEELRTTKRVRQSILD